MAHGLYLPADTEVSTAQRIVNTSVSVPGSVVTGWAAAFWMGVQLLERRGPIPLNVDVGRRPRSSARVTIQRRQLSSDEWSVVRGIAVTAPVRTALDGASGAVDAVEAVVFVDMMLASGIVAAEDVREAGLVDQGNGSVLVRSAIRDCDNRSRSPQESRFRMVWMHGARMSRPLVNARILSLGGHVLAVVDLLDLETGVVGEFDGADHRSLERHTADNVREERLEAHGLIVVRATALDLVQPDQLVRRIRTAAMRGLARDRANDRWCVSRAGIVVPSRRVD